MSNRVDGKKDWTGRKFLADLQSYASNLFFNGLEPFEMKISFKNGKTQIFRDASKSGLETF